MKRTDDYMQGLLSPREIPTPDMLRELLRDGLTEAQGLGILDRMERAHNTRKAWWPGQAPDGRKWPDTYAKDGVKIFPGPFPGASDTRVTLADEAINEAILVTMAALSRSEVQIVPKHGGETAADKAGQWRTVLAYYATEMQEEIMQEGGLHASVVQTFGVGVIKADWLQTWTLAPRSIAPQELLDRYVMLRVRQLEQELPTNTDESLVTESLVQEWSGLILGEDKRASHAKLTAYCLMMLEDCPEQEAKRVATQVQQMKPTIEYFAFVQAQNRPQVRALIPWVNIFWQPGARHLDEAAWIAEVEHFPDEGALRAKALVEDWDAQALEGIIASGGGAHWDLQNLPAWTLNGADVGLAMAEPDTWKTERKGYAIYTVWRRATSQGGMGAWYFSVLHGGVGGVLKHGVSPYRHLCHPYVAQTREYAAMLVASRGMAEAAEGPQAEMKRQIDSRTDRTALDTNPPWQVPALNSGGRVDIRPGVQIPMKTYGGSDFLRPLTWPNNVGASVEIEQAARQRFDSWALRGPNVDPDLKRLYWQSLADSSGSCWRRVWRRLWPLVGQFVDKLSIASIGGIPVDLSVSGPDLLGDADVTIKVDAGDLTAEFIGRKLEWIGKLLVPLDVSGSIDRDALVRLALTTLDPKMAAAVYREQGSVTQKEVSEEMNALAQIVSGLEPVVSESGINPALRLNVINTMLQKSPLLAQKLTDSEQAQAVLKSRMQRFQFQIEQRQNAQIGRMGGSPALDKLTKQPL